MRYKKVLIIGLVCISVCVTYIVRNIRAEEMDSKIQNTLGLKKIIDSPDVILGLLYDPKLTDDQYWDHFSKLLPTNLLHSLKELCASGEINVNEIGGLLKCDDKRYILLNKCGRAIAKGAYVLDISKNPPSLSEEKLTFASNVVDIFETQKHGVWVLVNGGWMKGGVGGEQYELISLRDPRKSFRILYTEYLSEEMGGLPINELEKDFNIQSTSEFKKYELTSDGKLKFDVIEKDLKTSKEKKIIYFVEEQLDGLGVNKIELPL